MINLLQSNVSEGDLVKMLSPVPRRAMLPALGSSAWTRMAQLPAVLSWMEPLRKLAEKEISKPMPELTEDLYREFYQTHTRLPFEVSYFERRRRFGRAAICALLADEAARGPWIKSMLEKAADLFSEFSWALPAHVNAPSGQDPMQIDLFGAETANLMAEVIALFGSVLPADFVEKIHWRLRNQFFQNYLERHEDFNWTKAMNNWNAVCHQGVIGAALTIEEDTKLLAKMLLLMKKYLPLFLRGFGSDGACGEGPGYWQYGFGWFSLLNEQLETRTAGQLSLVEGDAHIREIAKYGPRVTLANHHFVNFGDSPRSGALSPYMLTYLGKRLRDETLLAHGYRTYQRLEQTGINLQGQRTDMLYLTRLILNCPTDHSAERHLEPQDVYLRDLSVIVAHSRDVRGNQWDFAAKAGNNAESHNHNDCGSYLLNVNGTPAVVEIGAPEYTKDFFRENRYNYLAARTLGHSLPIVNGCEQAAGPQYAAKILNCELTEDHVEFSVDLTACYPSNAHCADLARNFYFDKKHGLLRVKEFYDLLKFESYETSVITEEEVSLDDDLAAVIRVGTQSLIVRPTEDTLIHMVEKHEYRDHSGMPRKVNRIILRPAIPAEHGSVGYELELLRTSKRA